MLNLSYKSVAESREGVSIGVKMVDLSLVEINLSELVSTMTPVLS